MGSEGFRQADLVDQDQGTIKLLWPIPKAGNPWGVLEPLRETPWGDQIPEVDGEPFSHALHGFATPLMRVIGVHPKYRAQRLPHPFRTCAMWQTCVGFRSECEPGPGLPDCYEPPGLEMGPSLLATRVAQAWKEGRYVIVVTGAEFSLS